MGFFACYLLTPVNAPQRLRCTYVGFTVAPTRRIRQHNGELVNGAKRTTKHRPWEMVVVVHGFPSKFHALQFEYAWQHPYNCRFTKERLLRLKGTKGLGHPRSVKRKLVELHEMLHVAPWTSFPLTISYTNSLVQNIVRPSLFFQWPAHMTCEVRQLHEFARLQAAASDAADQHDTASIDTSHIKSSCVICDASLAASDLQVLRCYHSDCSAQYHALCLADHFILELSMREESEATTNNDTQVLRPEQGSCPECAEELLWPLLVRSAASKPREKKTKRKTRKKQRLTHSSSTVDDVSERSRVCDSSVRNAPDAASVECSTVSSDDYDASGWFEDDASSADYLDADDYQEKGINTSASSVSTTSLQQVTKPTKPVVVDLTLDD